MEDTTIIKQHYAYMFRVDLSCNETSKLQIEEWLDKYSFTHYLGNHEIGTETQKHHYQMIVWREHKFTIREQTACRNWWRNKTNSQTHGAALTSARKVASLAAYSIKENISITNLNKEQLDKVPLWKNKTALKQKNFDKIEEIINKTDYKHLTKYEFCTTFSQAYYTVMGKPCMHRNTYIKYLYKYNYIKNDHIVAYVFNLQSEYSEIPGFLYPELEINLN